MKPGSITRVCCVNSTPTPHQALQTVRCEPYLASFILGSQAVLHNYSLIIRIIGGWWPVDNHCLHFTEYECPLNWYYFSHKCYRAFNLPRSFAAAQSFCRRNGGELMRYEHQSDSQLVRDMWVAAVPTEFGVEQPILSSRTNCCQQQLTCCCQIRKWGTIVRKIGNCRSFFLLLVVAKPMRPCSSKLLANVLELWFVYRNV